MANTTIKSGTILTIDEALRVRLHAMSGGALALSFNQSLPCISFDAHMSSKEARTLAAALVDYADAADAQPVEGRA